ncbi:unnamed protein product [Schistosoma mattheei]|uniref:Uncharacterized protein n=1 Tax=Schistosoma mattheei TaxID=31246 RepID=A0A183NL74_9TREM|nr:unnamed protein product [Schistosoma mattheei]
MNKCKNIAYKNTPKRSLRSELTKRPKCNISFSYGCNFLYTRCFSYRLN